jgi:hypothetical protein
MPIRTSALLSIAAQSGSRDVELVFADSEGYSVRGLFCIRSAPFEVSNLRIVKAGDRGNIGLSSYHTYFHVANCEFENFDTGIRVESALGNIQYCNYINCNTGILAIKGGHAAHIVNTATGTNYINCVDGGTIIKKGSQGTGVVMTDRIIAGQII